MRFDLTIPDPSNLRVGKEAYISLEPDTELHRIHPTVFQPEQFNDTDKGDARFSPIRKAARIVIPTLYGAESFECAACEIILRCPDVPSVTSMVAPQPLQIVYPVDFARYSHSVVRTNVRLDLVDLTVAGQRKIGINGNALLAGPKSTYPMTRRWAEQIHAQCPSAQGLYYSSFQFGPHFAVVLFADRLTSHSLKPASSRLVAASPCHDEVRALAQSLSIDYEDI